MFKTKIPASTANLGAGFDTLGIALNLYNEIIIERSDKTVIETYPRNPKFENPEKNLFYVVLKETLEFLGKKDENFYIKQYNNIPISRGLGSSAAVIVGGIITAFHIAKRELTDELFFKLAYKYENHPDNLIPAWKGGFIVSTKTEEATYYNKLDFPEELSFVAIVPELELSTEDARRVLPKEVPLKDAVFNIQRVALFLSALQLGKYELLKVAMEDRLHQPYRKQLIPGFDDVISSAYDKGALGVSLSGAGSTIIAIARDNLDEIGKAMKDAFNKQGIKSDYKILKTDKDGAKVEEI